MDQSYQAHGIRFKLPSGWELSEQETDREISISVDSPETAFCTLSLFLDRPPAQQIIQTALQTFQEEYDDLDVYNSDAQLCRRETVSQDLEFIYLELVNCVLLRAFETDRFTVLVLFQSTDHELEKTRKEFEGICRSLSMDFDVDMSLE